MATKAIPVVAAKVAATLADYPAYVKPSAMTGWGALTLAEAQSIRFYSDEALTTELARDVVSADEIHVKVPSLTTTTTIYADYNGTDSDYAVTDTYGRNAVWGGFSLVHHMEGGTVDATGSGASSTNTNVTFSTTDAKIEQNAFYNGTNAVSKTTFQIPTSYTVSYWVRPGNQSGSVMSKDVNSSTRFLGHEYSNTPDTIDFRQWNASGTIKTVTAGSIAHDNWYKVDLKWNASGNFTYYINGVEGTTNNNVATSGSARNSSAYQLWYGERQYTGSPYRSIQRLDEVRWTTTLRSADWITTEYNNQSDVATFWGTVTDAGGATANNSARRMLLMGM